MIAALWLCFVYETDYKKTICDTAISPDKKYELILEAVREAEWPFGSASGRLIRDCKFNCVLSEIGM